MPESHNEIVSEKPIKLSRKERQQLAVDNLPLVMSVAKRFRNCGLNWDDLVAYGNVGLVYAANRFDPNRGFQFSTYAVSCIKGHICRALDSESGTYVPRNKARIARNLVKTYDALAKELKRKPTIEELAAKTDMSCEQAQDLLDAAKAKNSSSLDAPLNEDGASLVNLMPSELPTPDSEAANSNAKAYRGKTIRQVCKATLSRRNREILAKSFGLYGYDEDGSTLKEAGDEFGLSRERVRQIIAKAFEELRSAPELRQAYEEALAA